MLEAIEFYAAGEAAGLISKPELDALRAICDERHVIARSIKKNGSPAPAGCGESPDTSPCLVS